MTSSMTKSRRMTSGPQSTTIVVSATRSSGDCHGGNAAISCIRSMKLAPSR
jgi:hypothetical protein